MDSQNKERLIVDAHLSQTPEIGRWLWALQDTRQRTMMKLEGMVPALIDWIPAVNKSSIGTVLYHMADIEADWLYVEVLEQPIAPEVATLFPYKTRDEQSNLTQVHEFSLEQHLRRLDTVRSQLLNVYQQMDLTEFRRVRSLAAYDVTPEWVLHHLMQHEAEHRGQIGELRAEAERHIPPG